MKDPLDLNEPPSLAEQIEPYREFGDAELAISLLKYQRSFGGPGLPSAAADVGYSFYCPNCEENVRSISRPNGEVSICPLCHELPGMLALGEGPR